MSSVKCAAKHWLQSTNASLLCGCVWWICLVFFFIQFFFFISSCVVCCIGGLLWIYIIFIYIEWMMEYIKPMDTNNAKWNRSYHNPQSQWRQKIMVCLCFVQKFRFLFIFAFLSNGVDTHVFIHKRDTFLICASVRVQHRK